MPFSPCQVESPVSRPFRYTFILILVAVAVGLAAAGGWRYARASAPVSGPIILISIDTLRADHLPAYGYTQVQTPAIDALAADGVVFERAYSHAPQTLPAHAALLSGRLPFETGVRDNVGFTVKPGERLLPQMLRDRGFATGGVVSAFVLRKDTGIGQGFDFFDGEMPPASADTTIGQVQRDGAESEAIAEQWLTASARRASFLFLHLYEPHKPYAPPDRFAAVRAVRRRDRLRGRDRRPAGAVPQVASALRPLDDRAAVGSRRRARRSRRTGTRAVRLRRSDPRAADHQAGGQRRRRPPRRATWCSTSTSCRRFSTWSRRRCPGDLRGRSLKPLLDGTGQPAGAARLLGGAVRALSLRLERTDRDDRRALSLHQGAARGALRSGARSARTEQHRGRARAGATRRCVARSTVSRRARPSRRRPTVSADARERLQALGYVGSQTELAGSTAKRSPDPKDKREILERYRAAIDLAGERKWPQAIAQLQQILRQEPEMADVWASSRRSPVGSIDSTRCSRHTSTTSR